MKCTIAAILAIFVLGAAAEAKAVPERPHVCPPPPEAQGKAGIVTVALTITAKGTVKDPAVLDSSGDGALDAAALACVREWRYKPASRNGRPVDSPWRAGIRFGAVEPDPRVEALSADIRRCVLAAGVVDPSPQTVEITDLHMTFAADTAPQTVVQFSTGSDSLKWQVEDCARSSLELEPLAQKMPGATKVITFNWTLIQAFANGGN